MKKKDKNHTYTHTHILDSYHKGIIDCMLLSITVLFLLLFVFVSFFDFTVIPVVKRGRKKLIRELRDISM